MEIALSIWGLVALAIVLKNDRNER